MDILVKFKGDVKYAKLDIAEVQNNIPDDLRMLQIRVKSKSIDYLVKMSII